MTGWPVARACFVAWRFGESSQHSVVPHSWQVRRWIQVAPVFTHSAHSRRFGCLTAVILSICEQLPFDVIGVPSSHLTPCRPATHFMSGLVTVCPRCHRTSCYRNWHVRRHGSDRQGAADAWRRSGDFLHRSCDCMHPLIGATPASHDYACSPIPCGPRGSAIVNVRAVASLERYGKSSFVVHLRSGANVISSRFYQPAIRRLLREERQ